MPGAAIAWQWLASKGWTRLQDTLRRRENGGLAAFGQRREYFLPPAPNGDHGIVPAAQGAEGLDRASRIRSVFGYSLSNLAAGDPGVADRPKILRATSTVTSSTATLRNAAAAANEWA